MPKRLIDSAPYPSYKERVLAVYPNAVCKRTANGYVVFSDADGADGQRLLGYEGYTGSAQAVAAWMHAFEHVEGRE